MCTPSASIAEVARSSTAASVVVVKCGGNEESGLAKVLGQREATGQGQVADDAPRDDALDRDVGGVGLVRSRRVVGEIPLEDHVGPVRPERRRGARRSCARSSTKKV